MVIFFNIGCTRRSLIDGERGIVRELEKITNNNGGDSKVTGKTVLKAGRVDF